MSLDLSDIRTQISQLDRNLLKLLAERHRLAFDVVRSKEITQKPLRDIEREKELLQGLVNHAESENYQLDPQYVTQIFQRIIEDSVLTQQNYLQDKLNAQSDENVSIAFLGMRGSYSNMASRQFAKKFQANLVELSCNTFAEVFEKVSQGEAKFGVLPLENTTSGSINEVYDLLQHTDLLLSHAKVTLVEIALGLICGFILGLISALLLTLSRRVSAFLMPLLVISQAVPVFAIAPLLVLWLGYGMASKIAMAVLIIYFPVTAACYDGLRNTPQSWLQLAQTLQISPQAMLFKVRLPAALPALASGLRIAVSIAPIGAVVGEWVGSSEGLGYLMLQANARMQIDLMFAALFLLLLIALCLYFFTDYWLRRSLPWVRYIH